jgi:hypothetical protein
MSFILAAQRDADAVVAFNRYREYLNANAAAFPRGALDLAKSNWYFNANDHRCPHDAWLESITISEPARGKRNEIRSTAIRVRLLGAYHDGYIELFYPHVLRYSLNAASSTRGVGDWGYDEFRVAPGGHLIHEIEWFGFEDGARWVIEASDVEFQWIPK